MVKTKDARQVETVITYGCIGGASTCAENQKNLYPTKTETAANHSALKRTSAAVYDFHTGLVTTATDVDNGVSVMTEYDALGRPIKVRNAANSALESWVRTEYNDTARRVIVRSDVESIGDGRKVAIQHYDQLGRVRLSRSLENAATEDPYNETDGIKVETRYSTGNPNSYQITSNPFRAAYATQATSEPTMGWTRSKSWNTGRKSEVETFSGAALPAPWGTNAASTGIVTTDIDANATTVADQAGKLRRSIMNALGQMTRVDEPNGSNALGTVAVPNQPTTYEYDTLNNLKTVTQAGSGEAQCGPGNTGSCSQTRTFTYNSLSQLLSANNPESGLINYVYDNNGNLTKKTDARGVQTDYVYDALNRVANRNYSLTGATPPNYQATPNVSYFYDNITNAKGKLIKVTNGTGVDRSTTEYTSFDILGRVTASRQTTDNVTYGSGTTDSLMTYTYNLSGALIEQQYPSGRKVKTVLDNEGDLAQVQSQKNAADVFRNYASSFVYNSAGAVSSMKLGNGKFENTVYNSRLQPIQIGLGSSASTQDKLKLNYDYGTTQNNGNVLSQIITVPTVGSNPGFTATQAYSYDSLNRIAQATETIPNQTGWNQTFTYDRYGKRNFVEAPTTTLLKQCNNNTEVCVADRPKVNPSVDVTKNRLIGYAFDNAGNTTTDADAQTFTYDAENKQVQANNAQGIVGQYFYDGDGKRVKKIVPGTGETTIFVYDARGKLVAEYSTIVEPTATAQISYLTNDHLGSPRINTDRDGNIIARHDYHPFGEEIATPQRISGLGYSGDTVRKQFTGYENDGETGLDYAQARMYKSALGRFASTDPILFAEDRAFDPQRINLFLYSRNNPYAFSDPSGEDIEEPSGLSDEDQKAYEKWRDKFLSTKEGRKTWDRYKNDKNFLLKIAVVDRSKKSKGAEVKDYVFDGDRNLVGATMELGRNLGKGLPSAGNGYLVQGALQVQDSATIGAIKIAHEFGHLDDAMKMGKDFYNFRQMVDAYNTEARKPMTPEERANNPQLAQMNSAFKAKYGTDILVEDYNDEVRAEINAIPTIRQLYGSIPKSAQKAVRNFLYPKPTKGKKP